MPRTIRSALNLYPGILGERQKTNKPLEPIGGYERLLMPPRSWCALPGRRAIGEPFKDFWSLP